MAETVEVVAELAELKGKERGDKVREMFAEMGAESRGTIAKMFGTSYQQIYQYTKPKDGEPRAGRARVILPNGQPRAEWIREQYAAGKKRGEILKELREFEGQENVPYQIIYAATKPVKEGEASADGATETEAGSDDETFGEDEDGDLDLDEE